MGSFLSTDSDKNNANPSSEDTKETAQEKEEGSQKTESLCTGKTGVPNKTKNIQKGKAKRGRQKKNL